MLRHAHEENPECPIASYGCDGGILGGVYIYDTEEQAAEAWNRRVDVVHGRWMPFHSEAAGDIQYCSACEIGFDAKMDYCPHCGAKMDGGEDCAVS